MIHKPTAAEIENAKSARGGWTKATLAEWGVPWPPPKGWKEALTGKKKAFSREKWEKRMARQAYIDSPESSFEDEGGLVKRPICTVRPEDVDCPFGHAGGRHMPYLSDEDWNAEQERRNGIHTD